MEYDEYSVHIYNRLKAITPSPYQGFPGRSQGFHDGRPEPALRHTVRALTTPSLIKLLNILDIWSPPDRAGVDNLYMCTLAFLALDGRDAGPYHVDSQSIQAIWDRWYIDRERAPGLWEELADAVRAEWKGKLTVPLSS